MRIGINAMLLGPQDSGVELYIRGLVRALAAVDTENEYVIYAGGEAGEVDVSGNPRFRVVRVGPARYVRSMRILWEQVRLPQRVREDRVDVLHAAGYVMPLRCPCPVVATIHDVLALTRPGLCKTTNVAHYTMLIRQTLRSARRIAVSSTATREEILRCAAVDASKIEVVYPGIDEPFFKPPTGTALDRVRERHALSFPFVLFVGNLEPKKNIPFLIEAFSAMKTRRNIRHRLLLAGKLGWKTRAITNAVEASPCAGEIVRLGYVPREDVPGLYALADLFVFPSICEGFGIPPLESMAAGTPVVASRAEALVEVLGDAALCVRAEWAYELETAMYKVLSNEFLRVLLRERGKARARRYSWRKTAEQMIRLYQQAATQ